MQLANIILDPWSVTCVLDEAVMIVTMPMTRVLRLSCVLSVGEGGRVRCKHITLTPRAWRLRMQFEEQCSEMQRKPNAITALSLLATWYYTAIRGCSDCPVVRVRG